MMALYLHDGPVYDHDGTVYDGHVCDGPLSTMALSMMSLSGSVYDGH